MSWLPAAAVGGTSLDAVFSHRPELYRDFRRFFSLFFERQLVDPVLLELCRLRVAQLLDCRSELSLRYQPAREAGLREEQVAALSDWRNAPGFSECERACLDLAERFVRDPHSISDDGAAAVREHLGAAQMVALVEALALFDGFARFRVLLGVEPAADGVRAVPAPRTDSASLA